MNTGNYSTGKIDGRSKSGMNTGMNTGRLYAASKRKRQVYLKKLTILLSVVMLAAGLGIAFGSNPVSAHEDLGSASEEQKYYKSIEVASGDTLWDLAEEYMGDDYDSVQSYVREVKQINGLLSGDDIHEGQFLTIPYYDI